MSTWSVPLLTFIITAVILIIIGLLFLLYMLISPGDKTFLLVWLFVMVPAWLIGTAIISAVIAGCVAVIGVAINALGLPKKFYFIALLLIPFLYVFAVRLFSSLPEKIWNYKPKEIKIEQDDKPSVKRSKIKKLKRREGFFNRDGELLINAVSNADAETITMLVKENNEDINGEYRRDTPLTTAIEKGNLEIMKLLIDLGADVNRKGEPLMRAAIKNNLPAINLLLDSGAQINAINENYLEKWTSLMEAANHGNTAAVQLFIERGADATIKNTNDETAFDMAVGHGHTDTAKILFAAMGGKIDINALNKRGDTLLIDASDSGYSNPEIVKYILSLGADIEGKNRSGNTALAEAAYRGNTEIVLLLLENGADINAKNKRGENALYWAVKENHPDTVKELLDAGIKDKNYIWSASSRGREKIVYLLLEAGANPNETDINGKTALMAAVEGDYTDVIELLLNAGADVNAKDNEGKTALSIANAKNKTESVRLLLEKITGKDTSDLSEEEIKREVSNNLAPSEKAAAQSAEFEHACRYDYRETIDRLLAEGFKPSAKHASVAIENHKWFAVKKIFEAGLDPNQKDDRGIHLLLVAIGEKDLEIVKLLAEKGADLNVEDKDFKIGPPLVTATIHGSFQIVKYLLEKGVDINSTNQFGETALIMACAKEETGIGLFLIENGADVNKPKENGDTPLLFAAGNENITLIKLLLKAGANVNFGGQDNYTPLMHACSKGKKEAAKLLLEAGAKTDIRDSDGKTAMDYAKEKNSPEIAELLKSYGAK